MRVKHLYNAQSYDTFLKAHDLVSALVMKADPKIDYIIVAKTENEFIPVVFLEEKQVHHSLDFARNGVYVRLAN